MKLINRRTVLRGAGGAAIALPLLEAMAPTRSVRARSDVGKVGKGGRPKRFVNVFTWNGQGAGWFANTAGPDGLVLGPVLAPMERHRKDLVLIDGICNMVALRHGQAGHEALLNFMTCVPAAPGRIAQGISIDQLIAREIAGDTKFKSLQMAISNVSYLKEYTSVAGPGATIPPIIDPQKVFAKLFSDLRTDPAAFERARVQRRSILDNVKEDYVQFATRVSGEDRPKVQTHLDALRELEKRIGTQAAAAGGGAGTCAAPRIGATATGPERHITIGQSHMELTAMAFACDLTRVASLSWNNAEQNGGPPMPWIEPGFLLHNASHSAPPGRNKASTWYAGYFARFIDRLKAIEDSPGTSIWDNTLFYWNTEHGAENHNNYRETPLIAAGVGVGLRTNQRLVFPYKVTGFNKVEDGATDISDMYVSFLRAMGIPATKFGSGQFSRGPLPGLLA